jgi:iron complex transport system substrate-binding protein
MNRSFHRTLASAALACTLSLLPGAHAAAADGALTVTDDSGAAVTLARPARRVVSLAPHATELVYAAGGGAAMVGAVSYSDYPPEAARLPRVGDNRALDLERIAALRPDLIVVWQHGNADKQLDALHALGVPLFYSDPHRLDGIAGDLRALGTLLGTPEDARRAADAFDARIAALRRQYAAQPPVKVFYQVWDKPLMTLNAEHIISDVIALCGGVNVFARATQRVPTISTEAVLATAPEAIVTAAPGRTAPSRPLPGLQQWLAWPQLPAVAMGNLFAIDGDLINRSTPRLAEGAAQLCRDLQDTRKRRGR